MSFQSRPLLPLAWEQFERQKKPPRSRAARPAATRPAQAAPRVVVDCRGNEEQLHDRALHQRQRGAATGARSGSSWTALAEQGFAVSIVDRAAWARLRPTRTVKGHDYADPLAGVEENIAYNAFLVGKCLAGMRVADVLAAVEQVTKANRPQRIVLCGRRDAALVACLAAAVEPAITHVAVEELRLDLRSLFVADAQPINAASIVPGLLSQFGDMPDVLAQIAPRKVLAVSPVGKQRGISSVQFSDGRLTDAGRLSDFLR